MTDLEETVWLLLKNKGRMAIARVAKELAQPQSSIIRAITGLEAAGRVVRDGNHVRPK